MKVFGIPWFDVNSDGTGPFFNLFYIFLGSVAMKTNKQRKLTTVNQKTHQSISIIDHCYWGCRGSRGRACLASSLRSGLVHLCVGKNQSQTGRVYFLIGSSQSVQSLRILSAFHLCFLLVEGEKGGGGAKPRRGVEVGGI